MSNPFTAPTIGAGYRASEPPDDDTAVAANAVSWSKHIDKIATPLKDYADAIITNVTTAFGTVYLNGVTTKSSAYTVVAGDRGELLDVSGTSTITLLASATAGAGFVVTVRNTGTATDVTIDGNGSETINGATTVLIPPGYAITLVSDGTNWSGLWHTNVAATKVLVTSNTDTTTGQSGTWKLLTMDLEVTDAAGTFASNKWTPGVIGQYFVHGSALITASGSGNLADGISTGVRITRFNAAGNAQNVIASQIAIGASGTAYHSVAGILRIVAADDYFGLEGVAGATNWEADASGGPWFGGWRIN